MRRIIFIALRLFVLAAIVTRVAEAAGVWRRCGCAPECWCKKPGLSLFRWVVPLKHRALDPQAKQALAEIDAQLVA
jgi:hypothetical protein